MLGEKQSGPIDVVGLTLFSKMIESAIKILKGEKIIDQADIDIDIGIYGFIPEEIIPQAELRLSIYKEISSIKENKNLDQNKKDFIDRFGDVTSEITNLYELSKLKNVTNKASIRDAVQNADLVILHTEWNDFKSINFKNLVKGKKFIIFDMRNLYSSSKIKQQGFKYYSVGK